MGQSNMQGQYGPINSTLDATNARIIQWGRTAPNNNLTILAADPLEHVSITPNTIGMGLTFAKAYLATLPSNRGVLLVPCAKGGTGFSTNDWNPGDSLYEDALARINAAVASGHNNVLKGILWHQGESDSASSQGAYAAALDVMIADLRNRATGAVVAPFICGGTLVGGSQTAAGVTAALLDTPNRNQYTAYVAPTGLTSGGDNLHFSAASLRTLGGWYYTAMATAMANNISGISGLTLWLESDYGVTKEYNANGFDTVSGTATTHTLVSSTDLSLKLYAGMLIGVSTDNYTVASIATVMDISTITTVEALSSSYTDADLSAQVISQWNDRSGNAYHVTPSNIDQSFAYLPSASNSKPALIGFSVTDALRMDYAGILALTAGNTTIFVVAKTNVQSDSAKQLLFIGDNDTGDGLSMGYSGYNDASGEECAYFNSGSVSTDVHTPNIIQTDFAIIRGRRNSTTQAVSFNNSAEVTDTTATNVTSTVATIGNNIQGPTIRGQIQAVLVYNSSLSPANIIVVENYLAAKYGITLS